MPKVLCRNFPKQLFAHLLARIQERRISAKELALLSNGLISSRKFLPESGSRDFPHDRLWKENW